MRSADADSGRDASIATVAGALRLTAWVRAVACAQFAALIATSSRYGDHRDEVWQTADGWPQLMVAANVGGSAEGGESVDGGWSLWH